MTRCVHRVALDRGGLQQLDAREIDEAGARRRREADKLSRSIFDTIVNHYPEALRPGSVAETREALDQGADIIVSPRPPDDLQGHRRAQVDVLVRVGRHEEKYLYAPAIIRNILVSEGAATRRIRKGDAQSLRPSEASWCDGVYARRNDPVQRAGVILAHAYRVLEALGHASPDTTGGIFDRDSVLWWLELNDGTTSHLDRYDAAYRERLGVMENQEKWAEHGGHYPTSPYWHRECEKCPYESSCEAILTKIDDVSLVRYSKFTEQMLMREAGISTWRDLAGLDPVAAAAAFRSVLSATETYSPVDYLAKQVAQLPELIYRARSMVLGHPTRKVSADNLSCPTADIEIDVDMESYDECTYLWGAVVRTSRPIDGVREGYHEFSHFGPLTPEIERDVFVAFWDWFQGVRVLAERAQMSFAAYCFYENAENGSMRRAIATGGVRQGMAFEVESFLGSSSWIDLHKLCVDQIQSDGKMGLKQLAPAAGFAWRDEEPGGEASMSWFETAIAGGSDAEASRTRILEYNEDDCRATQALRDWLNGAAKALPHRDDPVS
jgi:predicted RecB family nuclease